MTVNGQTAVYRFIIQPKTANDPRSLGFTSDAHTLGFSQIEHIECHDLIFLRGSLSPQELRILADRLLHDPVTQSIDFSLLPPPPASQNPSTPPTSSVIEVVLKPGVTDPVAEQVVRAAALLGIDGIEAASTGFRFIVHGERLTVDLLQLAAKRLFANNVIHTYAIGEITPVFSRPAQSSNLVGVISLRDLDDAGLLRVSTERRAALNLDEMRAIQDYSKREERDLTDIEFEMLAQTWSEHCVHKTFKARVKIECEPGCTRPYPSEYDHLFNQTIRAATRAVNAPWVRSAFTENAGIVEFDGENEISFKVETHNHPSAIEPFGGANTGIGGVIRDIIGVSAKPIASTDILCFGPADLPLADLPEGVLHPRRIASGVVAGIQDYGNKMGIPTVNGAIWFDPGYTANPLVYCGSVGIAPKGSNPHQLTPGDHIIVLGGRTGRDGLRGATFSSMTMDAQTGEVSGASVQIGAPVVEKGLVDVLMRARDQKLYHAITDCGAGGFSSAVGEMASESGGDVQLENVPLKYPGLSPWEVWLSEAQERMVIAVPKENLPALRRLCDEYEVEMTDIGCITDSGRMRIFYAETKVLDLENEFLHHGLPQRTYQARVTAPRIPVGARNNASTAVTSNFDETLLRLLSHPNIASKERVIRDYDHEVQGGTVVKPLCGTRHDGPSDGAVIKPVNCKENHAFVLTNGLNPEYGKLDAAQMTWLAVDEAIRNAVACGADPRRIALLDNFCWGDPTRPEIMGDLVKAAQACYDGALRYQTPFISGKDSFNNEYLGTDGRVHAIPPTLLISALGWMQDWRKSLTMDFKAAGDLLFLVGDFKPAFGGSHYNLIHPDQCMDEGLPVCSEHNPGVFRTLHAAIQKDLVAACHDLSEGGLAVAAAEMAMAGRLGCTFEIGQDFDLLRSLFGETSGCFVVEIKQEFQKLFEDCLAGIPLRRLGVVENDPMLRVTGSNRALVALSLASLLNAWKDRRVDGGKA